jgi:hypothetical protein
VLAAGVAWRAALTVCVPTHAHNTRRHVGVLPNLLSLALHIHVRPKTYRSSNCLAYAINGNKDQLVYSYNDGGARLLRHTIVVAARAPVTKQTTPTDSEELCLDAQ